MDSRRAKQTTPPPSSPRITTPDTSGGRHHSRKEGRTRQTVQMPPMSWHEQQAMGMHQAQITESARCDALIRR